MAEEEDEFLDEGDFDEDVTGADGEEVEEEAAGGGIGGKAGSEDEGRQDEDNDDGDDADEHGVEEFGDGHVDLGVRRSAAGFEDESGDVAGLDGVEEEGAVIRDGGDIEGVIALVSGRIFGEE